jgi:DNA-binding IclR family transcriptional regulator
MDEPTQGIDIGAKLEVYKVINELTASGISVILISSDFPELLAMCDRVAVVKDGRVLFIAEGQRMTEYQLIGMVSGVGVTGEITAWMNLRQTAFPQLQALCNHTKAAVHLGVLDRGDMSLFYLDKVGVGSTDMVSRTGISAPLGCTGLGKALLAYEPPEKVREWIDRQGLPKFTDHTITALDTFMLEMKTTRERGFSLELEEHENGVRCIAAPVRDGKGYVVAAISISVSTDIIPADLVNSPLHEHILETATAISQAIAAPKGG